ncbi:MAG: aldo/keto reductase [Phycisphaerales bacterium]
MRIDLDRRRFLATLGLAGGALALRGTTSSFARPIKTGPPLPESAVLGIHRELPRLGFGGYPIVRLPDDEGVAVVRRALDLGVRYFDTAPSYGAGKSERLIGRAIRESGIDRSELFVATKTLRRDGAGARRELDESLERLDLDFVDCVQAHEVHDDWRSLFEADGVIAALERARDDGRLRHIGITGHRNPEYLIKAIERYDGFATALVPVNPLDTKYLSFTKSFLPVALARGIGVVAMKVYGGGSLLSGDRFKARELLQYALSQPGVSIAVPGCDAIWQVDAAHGAVIGMTEPLSAERLAELEERAGEHEGRKSEWYKEDRDG